LSGDRCFGSTRREGGKKGRKRSPLPPDHQPGEKRRKKKKGETIFVSFLERKTGGVKGKDTHPKASDKKRKKGKRGAARFFCLEVKIRDEE